MDSKVSKNKPHQSTNWALRSEFKRETDYEETVDWMPVNAMNGYYAWYVCMLVGIGAMCAGRLDLACHIFRSVLYVAHTVLVRLGYSSSLLVKLSEC